MKSTGRRVSTAVVAVVLSLVALYFLIAYDWTSGPSENDIVVRPESAQEVAAIAALRVHIYDIPPALNRPPLYDEDFERYVERVLRCCTHLVDSPADATAWLIPANTLAIWINSSTAVPQERLSEHYAAAMGRIFRHVASLNPTFESTRGRGHFVVSFFDHGLCTVDGLTATRAVPDNVHGITHEGITRPDREICYQDGFDVVLPPLVQCNLPVLEIHNLWWRRHAPSWRSSEALFGTIGHTATVCAKSCCR